MTYKEAKKLNIGDFVTYKNSESVLLKIESIEDDIEYHNIFVKCDDGKLYHHTALK